MRTERDAAHYRRMMETNPNAGVGASLVARAVETADDDLGDTCEVETDYQHAVQDRYGESVASGEVLRLMGDPARRRRLTIFADPDGDPIEDFADAEYNGL